MNKWKLLFFIVVGLNLIMLIFLLKVLLQPLEEFDFDRRSTQKDSSDVEFVVHSNKSTLNTYINTYLKKNGNNSPFRYQVVLEDELNLTGELVIFNTKVDFLLTFKPEVLKDGNLLLRQQRIVLGQLDLPVPFVLNYIEKNYQLPEWVSIYPTDKTIHLKVTDLTLDQKYKLSMKTFDLVNDEIIFSLFPSQSH